MKKIILVLIFSILLLSCSRQEVAIPSALEDFATFALTKSDAPFEQTIWEHTTDNTYNTYLYFHDDVVSLFYGKNDGELQRWSDYYDGSFSIDNGRISINLSYPDYGQTACIYTINIIKGDAYTLTDNLGNTYAYYGQYTDNLEDMWMSITAKIVPWE